MSLKDLPVYKELLARGYVYLPNAKGKNTNIVIQHKDQIGREPIKGDRKYIIQESGYLISQFFKDTIWGGNQVVINRFQAGLPNYDEIGLEFLLNHIKYKDKEIDTEQSAKNIWKLKNIPESRIIIKVFSAFPYMLRDEETTMVFRLFNKGKKYQALNRMLRVLGIQR